MKLSSLGSLSNRMRINRLAQRERERERKSSDDEVHYRVFDGCEGSV